jgi:hypothetical protein
MDGEADRSILWRLERFGKAITFRDSIHTVTYEKKNTANHKYHGSCDRAHFAGPSMQN